MLIIVAIVLLFLLPSPWNVVALLSGVVLWIGELLFWNRTVRHRSPEVGAQMLIGTEAIAVSDCRPKGQVRIDGEIWDARCEAGASTGETVRIVGRERLTLIVEPSGRAGAAGP